MVTPPSGCVSNHGGFLLPRALLMLLLALLGERMEAECSVQSV